MKIEKFKFPAQKLAVKKWIGLFIVSQLFGCATLGSKSALYIDSESGWKTEHNEYRFDGGGEEKLIITLPQIVITKNTRAFGFILPVIPGGRNSNFTDNQLELRLTIVGYPIAEAQQDLVTISITTTSGKSVPLVSKKQDVVSSTRDNNKEHKLWVQYSLYHLFDVKLGELQQLILSIDLPMYFTKVPKLILSRKTGSDNQFTISPGR